MCSLSLYTHRVSESLMAVNCSGGSGPSSSETQSNICLLKILQVSVALFRLFKCYIIALIIILALFHFWTLYIVCPNSIFRVWTFESLNPLRILLMYVFHKWCRPSGYVVLCWSGCLRWGYFLTFTISQSFEEFTVHHSGQRRADSEMLKNALMNNRHWLCLEYVWLWPSGVAKRTSACFRWPVGDWTFLKGCNIHSVASV